MNDLSPPNLDLSALSTEQLDLLQQAIEKQKMTVKEKARHRVKEKIVQALNEAGLTLVDMPVLFPRMARPASKSGVVYRHPEKPRLTWTGKGRKPAWIKEYLTVDGNSLEGLKVK